MTTYFKFASLSEISVLWFLTSYTPFTSYVDWVFTHDYSPVIDFSVSVCIQSFYDIIYLIILNLYTDVLKYIERHSWQKAI